MADQGQPTSQRHIGGPSEFQPIKRVYLAGPMRGYPKYNTEAFNRAAADLRNRGFVVINPAENEEFDCEDPDAITEQTIEQYMAHDLPLVCQSDAIVVLIGWTLSQGANIEVGVAKGLKKPVLRYPNLEAV